jgi:thioredoxin reductase
VSEAAWDVIVVGGGPAGLAAATWLGRYRRRTLLLDDGTYRNRWTESSHGYLGSDPSTPDDLRDRALDGLAAYPEVVRRAARVDGAARSGDGGFVLQIDGREERARRLVLATGVVDEFPDIEGFFEHYGASIFHCPSCDGFEARDRDVVCIGWDEHVPGFALSLLDWARSVTVVTDGRRFDADEEDRSRLVAAGIDVVQRTCVGFEGERGSLRGLRFEDGATISCDLAFFSIAHHPNTELAVQLGCELTDEGCLQVDEACRTSVDGVYGAGDLTPGIQLVQVAAAKGAIAGVECARAFHGERGAPASPTPAPAD